MFKGTVACSYKGQAISEAPLHSLERALCFLSVQEMLAIMKSIYDMMGRYTTPSVKEDDPSEHVEKFFQVNEQENRRQSYVLSGFVHLFVTS